MLCSIFYRPAVYSCYIYTCLSLYRLPHPPAAAPGSAGQGDEHEDIQGEVRIVYVCVYDVYGISIVHI